MGDGAFHDTMFELSRATALVGVDVGWIAM